MQTGTGVKTGLRALFLSFWTALGLISGSASAETLNQRECKTYGSGIVQPFNGSAYHVRTSCSVTLVHFTHQGVDCDITAQRGNSGLLTRVEVVVNKVRTIIQNGTIAVENHRISLPYDHTYQHVFHYGIHTRLRSKVLPLTVTWHTTALGIDSLWVRLEGNSITGMSGLCGHLNTPANPPQLISEAVLEDDTCVIEDSLEELNMACAEFMSHAISCLMTQAETYFHLCQKNAYGRAGSAYITCPFFWDVAQRCGPDSNLWNVWRDVTQCPIPECPGELTYQEVGNAFIPSCSNPTPRTNDQDVTSTCVCPQGKVLNDRAGGHQCVNVSECPCVHGSNSYLPGAHRGTKCQTCECMNGKWLCSEDICPKRCSIESQFVNTFDGKHFRLPGKCSYVAAQGLNWTLTVQFSDRAIKLERVELQIYHESYIFSHSRVMFQNEEIKDLHQTALVTVFWQSSMFVQVLTHSGLSIQVQLSPDIQLYLSLPKALNGTPEGLCGNFNGDSGDDFTTSSGIVENSAEPFALSWALGSCDPDINHLCINMDSEIFADNHCSQIRDPHSLFSSCHSHVPYDWYYQACISKTCQCQTGLQSCLCVALGNYAKACASVGVSVGDWRATANCTVTCAANQVFDYATQVCNHTCRSLAGPDPTCDLGAEALEGCGCRGGTYLNDHGSCSPRSQCQCHHIEGTTPPGPVVIDGRACNCEDGKLNCSEACVCQREKVCVQCGYLHVNTAQKTCDSLSKPLIFSEVCNTGCYCPEGQFEDHNGVCVSAENCTCVFSGRVYGPGESVESNCKMCTCSGGHWDCTGEPCPGQCQVFGNGHYQTFDSRWFRFDGNCQYTLLEDDCGSGMGKFAVRVESIPCCDEELTCSRTITLDLLGEVSLVLGDMSVHSRPLNSSAVLAEMPYSVHTVGLYFLVSIPRLGLTLIWDKHTRLTVLLEARWRGRVCGLCGNFDSSEANDLLSSGSLLASSALEFGNSWKTGSPPCSDVTTETFPCQHHSYCANWAERRCMIITGDTFRKCHLKVDPEPYYQACLLEACSCEFEGKFLGFCTAVAAYAEACSEQNVCIHWRTPDLCPVFCDYYNKEGQSTWHYDPCGKIPTCGINYNFNRKLEGCYPRCPAEAPYYDENTGNCTTLQNCTCRFDGTVLSRGTEVSMPSGHCICTAGTMSCVPSTTTEPPTTTTLTTKIHTTTSTTKLPTTTLTTVASTTTREPSTTRETTVTTEIPTSTSTTQLPTSTSTTKLPTSTSTTNLPTTTSTTRLPTTISTTTSSTTIPTTTTLTRPPTTTSITTTKPPSTTEMTTAITEIPTTAVPTRSSMTTATTGPTITKTASTTTIVTTDWPTMEPTTITTTTTTATTPSTIPTTASTIKPTTATSTTMSPTTTSTETPTVTTTTTLKPMTSSSFSTMEPNTEYTELSSTAGTTVITTVKPSTTTKISTTTEPTTEHLTSTTSTAPTAEPTTTTTQHTTTLKLTTATSSTSTHTGTASATASDFSVITGFTQKPTTGHVVSEATTSTTTAATVSPTTATANTTTVEPTTPLTTKLTLSTTVRPSTTETIMPTTTSVSTSAVQPTTSTLSTAATTSIRFTSPTTEPTTITLSTTPFTTTAKTSTSIPRETSTTRLMTTTSKGTTSTIHTTTIEPTTTTTTLSLSTAVETTMETTEPSTTAVTLTTTTEPSTAATSPTTSEPTTTTSTTVETTSVASSPATESATTLRTTERTTQATSTRATTTMEATTAMTSRTTLEPTTMTLSTRTPEQPTTEITKATTIWSTMAEPTTAMPPTSTTFKPTSAKTSTTTSMETHSTMTTTTTVNPTTLTSSTGTPEGTTFETEPPTITTVSTTIEPTSTNTWEPTTSFTTSTMLSTTTIPSTTTVTTEPTTVEPTTKTIQTTSTIQPTTTTPATTTVPTTAKPTTTPVQMISTTQSTTATTISITTTTVPTTTPCECRDVQRNKSWSCGESWTEDCLNKECHHGRITMTQVPCPESPVPVCPRRQLASVEGECSHCHTYKCNCRCEVYGDPHYITFQGTSYDFLENCTYTLVRERLPRYQLSIVVDNYFCIPWLAGSCTKGITMTFRNHTITLSILQSQSRVDATLDQMLVRPPYEEEGIRFETTGLTVSVYLEEIRSYVSLTPSNTLVITLAMEHFLNNTEGQCGECGGSSCVRPGGAIENDSCCQKTAADWIYPDPRKPYCSSTPRNKPCYNGPPPPTPTPCPSPICDIFRHPVFESCGAVVNLRVLEASCRFDVCHSGVVNMSCSVLAQAAEECKKAGFCVEWHNLTDGICNVQCPDGKVYQECRDQLDDHCSGLLHVPGRVLEEMRSGCFCPEHQLRAGKHSDVCVDICTDCMGPHGEYKQPGDVWESNCNICTCDNRTRTTECHPPPILPSPLCGPDSMLVTGCCGVQTCEERTCQYQGQTYEVGDHWIDPTEKCVSFSCTNGGTLLERKVCPVETCPEELRIWDEHHCCYQCDHTCGLHLSLVNLTVGSCSASVTLPTCEGQCDSGSRWLLEGGLLQLEGVFPLCQEASWEDRVVYLTCDGHTPTPFNYKHITSCHCTNHSVHT